jgi:hypothetical protein
MRIFRHSLAVTALFALIAAPVHAQNEQIQAGLRVTELRAEPATVHLRPGQSGDLSIIALDADGNVVDAQIRASVPGLRFRPGRGISGANDPGEYELIASVVLPANADREPIILRVPITVAWPAIERVAISAPGDQTLYAGTTIRHSATALHGDDSPRPEARMEWSSTDPSVLTVDRFGNVRGIGAGSASVRAVFEGIVGELAYHVEPFPATNLAIEGGLAAARTGDVLTFNAVATGPSGRITDIPITWSLSFMPDDSIMAPGASGIIDGGKFVGETPGQYTVVASTGGLTSDRIVDVRPRDVVQEVELLGTGSSTGYRTSDLWIFEGVDGRDYAVTGTWGADGWAYFWDVTDPANLTKTDSIHVDARTVNDVKVSPDGRYAALSREGASNRRNGVVILDLADPAHPVVASEYSDGLTGGVHNMFATNDHLFALSNGDKYVILDVTDLANPTYVSEYNHPNSRVHDVWVYDGVAYSYEWGTGVVVVDVGNGKWGGSIENPVFVTNFPYPVGRTHAAFPYYQEDTGKFYLFLGDEIMGRGAGAAWNGPDSPFVPEGGDRPAVFDGYIHIVDFTDPANPRDVARYHVPEFGTHNSWVEDGMLYQAYYDGGLRVVDVSGELMGNLAEQGREVAVYKSFDPDNQWAANAPTVWGAQLHKGNVFFTDLVSGLWAVKITPRTRPIS